MANTNLLIKSTPGDVADYRRLRKCVPSVGQIRSRYERPMKTALDFASRLTPDEPQDRIENRERGNIPFDVDSSAPHRVSHCPERNEILRDTFLCWPRMYLVKRQPEINRQLSTTT
jgi:hypothetical protein